MPTSALAEGNFVSRRDAYLLIWNSINRPAFETAQEYSDVQEGDEGYLEISYGKRRKILLDGDQFYPDEPVILSDALLWIYRTRNVADVPDMDSDDLPSLISAYPIVEMNRPLDARVTRQDLLTMMTKIDGLLAKEIHEVSFYADDFHGQGTAFGETFNMHEITAAHRTLPHNTLVRVRNIETGESVVVRINDRGPYVDGRDMDLSKAAFEQIAHTGQGVLHATFERIGDADLVDACQQKPSAYQKRITRDVRFFRGIPHTFTLGHQLILQSNRVFVIYAISFPDGDRIRIQDFVHPEEKYRFSPDSPGLYEITVGDAKGHLRTMRMHVSSCGN
ncbi:septal ring lytic transglycosylase RlpA family protein [Candidatus Peribacteria bacterium]|nr:septal ring lytic transglycosylase RlpA family protein [Candidatus Peribacteria bacterium]